MNWCKFEFLIFLNKKIKKLLNCFIFQQWLIILKIQNLIWFFKNLFLKNNLPELAFSFKDYN